jgi:prepilin-type N-terminal cleavage/methylation domain-containing protein
MNKRGFTLIELLVVIAIVGILSSVIYMNITGIRDRARVTAGIRFDSSTLHSIGDQLVGEWLFDTNTSPTLDTSGSGNNGTLIGSPTWQETGGYNNKGAYSFNGSSNHIDLGNSSVFDITNTITISLWVKFSVGKTTEIIGKFNNANTAIGAYEIYQNSNNKIGFSTVETGSGRTLLSASIVPLNTWTHIVATSDGIKKRIFINGVQDQYTQTIISQLDVTTGKLLIGSYLDNSYAFNGLIDNIRIYSSALSGSEVQKLYAEGKTSHEIATE